MLKYPDYISKLISFLKKLPGIGFKSAEKIAFELLEWDPSQVEAMGLAMQEFSASHATCPDCFCLKTSKTSSCDFCSESRDSSFLCIVATPKDVFSFEKSKIFKGRYFVLGNLLSPITGKHLSLEKLNILKQRIEDFAPKEMIIALDATLEGDATALFLKQEFSHLPIKISRLALGMPVGLSFDFIDSNTLARAFSGRNCF
ncbi:recombination protein RecR [Chlamydia muridarum str. Nigg]|jgi:recombination protein RecR|uniref:Recombination protein RecR n=2 Tax=Chlamydia muridarum TaxID=83560 RepID=RECR_CHLMU|nr:recombination mediator RecR [Chlamydia muridarum]Q9PKF4.2 RecName: Full=Recombination protein RecR [Chlamydia muridarum str. Nigg]UFW99766.1 recombination protein RecR [Chlamydia trachomatis]AHH22900.1 recombinase RecR [Chlamydia muridarum str. Nigg3 CMUT3-5]AHH23825.1 recombinase RecR [Chlamydia muridarum str. Nigg CM972]AID38034.1 recombinase RecR [Chlamydia muridarum str. Nigg 2 MCR]AIT90696.1 recombinase RecR [Chlamydia muridarum]